MPGVSFSYFQKNGSTYLGNKMMDSDHVPRAGEVIIHKEMLDRLEHKALVLAVVNEIVNDELIVHVISQEFSGDVETQMEDVNVNDLIRFSEIGKSS